MLDYGDKVVVNATGKEGVVIGFMRFEDRYLIKGRDFEEWVYGRRLTCCSSTEKESGTP